LEEVKKLTKLEAIKGKPTAFSSFYRLKRGLKLGSVIPEYDEK